MRIADPVVPRYALVTPSYRPDLRRCELLVESLDALGGGHKHYLIIDRHDVPAFRHLRSARTEIIESEALVGRWLARLPFPRAIWLNFRGLPVRGWVLQQLLKIAIPDAVDEDVFVYCDSDVSFVKPFAYSDLLVDGKLGLLDYEFPETTVWPNSWPETWPATAQKLLGIGAGPSATRGFVGNMVCWRRANIEKMRARIEDVRQIPWQVALSRQFSFSEYVLYGTFIRDVIGYEHSGHAPTEARLVKPSWNLDLASDNDLDRFFAEIADETVAVMIHSKDGVDPARLRPRLTKLWRQAEVST